MALAAAKAAVAAAEVAERNPPPTLPTQQHNTMDGDTFVPAGHGGAGLPTTAVFAEGLAPTQLSAASFVQGAPAVPDLSASLKSKGQGLGGAGLADASGEALLETMSGVFVTKRAPLRARFQIGSKGGETNYPFEEKTFHVSDIPAEKLLTKHAVKQTCRPDLLERKPKPWYAGNQQPERLNLCDRQIRSIPAHDRPNMQPYNYRAEVLPPKNPQFIPSPHKLKVVDTRVQPESPLTLQTVEQTGTQRVRALGEARRLKEMCVHPDLEAAEPWHASTLCTRRERMARTQRDEQQRSANSARWTAKIASPAKAGTAAAARTGTLNAAKAARGTCSPMRMSGHQAGTVRGGYMSPQQRGAAEREAQRERKRLAAAGKTSLEDDAVQGTPPKPVLLVNRFAVEKSQKGHKWKHSGIWAMHEELGKEVWSDTLSEVKDSPGDIRIPTDPLAWNYASPSGHL